MSLPKETSIFGELSRSRAYIMYNICTLAVNLPMDAEKARDSLHYYYKYIHILR